MTDPKHKWLEAGLVGLSVKPLAAWECTSAETVQGCTSTVAEPSSLPLSQPLVWRKEPLLLRWQLSIQETVEALGLGSAELSRTARESVAVASHGVQQLTGLILALRD